MEQEHHYLPQERISVMKKILVLTVLILVVAALAVGCSFGRNKPAGDPPAGDPPASDLPAGDTPAKPDETRYTITAEEWAALADQYNYTLETTYEDEEPYTQKYTKDAIEIDESIILFVDDKQYQLVEGEDGWIADDVTYADFWHGGLLSNINFEDFFYDESICAYVNKDYEEEGSKLVIKFENGLPVSSVSFLLGEEDTPIVQHLYINIGTTVINIPEFTFDYELAPDPSQLVTEEEWNKFINEKNFNVEVVLLRGTDYKEYMMKSTGEAFEIGETVIVLDSDKKYALEETDGVWYAKEYDGVTLPEVLLPEGLDYNDFEFNVQQGAYVQKNVTGTEDIYSIGFNNGQLLFVQIQKAYDPERPDYTEILSYTVYEVGTVTIDVPDYVIAE